MTRPELTSSTKKRNDLQEWSRVLQAESHTLRNQPQFLFQQAANQPESTAPAAAAKEWSAKGLEKRPWFRWINKPREVSSCILTLNGDFGKISPDGSRIAAHSGNNFILWDTNKGEEIFSLPKGSNSFLFEFSRDSKRIATFDLSKIKLLDAANGKILYQDDYVRSREAFTFSPDNNLIVSGHLDGTIKIRNSDTGVEKIQTSDHNFAVDGCWFSSDGRQIISHAQSELMLWDLESGNTHKIKTPYEYGFERCFFSPDGARFMAVISSDLVVLYETSTGEELKKICLPNSYLAQPHVVFTPQGIRIYSRNFYELDEEMIETHPSLRNGETGSEITKLKGARDFEKLSQWVFSPNGEWIAIVSDYGTMQLLSSETGEVIRTFDEPKVSRSRKPAFLKDGAQIAACILNGNDIQLWETKTGKKLATLSESFYEAGSFCSTTDGSLILSNGGGGVMKLWDVKLAMKQSITPSGHTHEITSCVFASGSRQFATTSLDGNLILWDAENGAVKRKFQGPGDHMTTCAFSPHNPWIAGIAPDGDVVIWEIDSGREVGVVHGGGAKAPNPWDEASLAFSPDGRTLITGGPVRPMRLWKADESEEFPLIFDAKGIGDLATFSPDGHRILFLRRQNQLASGDAVLWDTATGKEIAREKSVYFCAYLPDGNRIVGLDALGSRIFNANDLSEALRLEESNIRFNGWEIFPDGSRAAASWTDWDLHPHWGIWDTAQGKKLFDLEVRSLKASPSGKHLLTSTVDKFVELRDAATGTVMLAYKFFHDLKVLRWSPDGRRIVCGYGSGEVLLLEPQNIKFSAPVVTAWKRPKSRWNPLGKEKCAIHCPVCAQWSELTTFSPGEEMDCPKCNQRLTLNPFTINRASI